MAVDAQWSAVARGYKAALILAAALGGVAIGVTSLTGHWIAGVFVCVGLGLGGWNSRRLWTDTVTMTDGTASAGVKWRGPAVSASARRLGLITLVAFLIAVAYRPLGWTVFLGLLVFQLELMLMLAGPLRKVARS